MHFCRATLYVISVVHICRILFLLLKGPIFCSSSETFKEMHFERTDNERETLKKPFCMSSVMGNDSIIGGVSRNWAPLWLPKKSAHKSQKLHHSIKGESNLVRWEYESECKKPIHPTPHLVIYFRSYVGVP